MVSQLGTFLATALHQTPEHASQPLLDLQLQCVQLLSFMEEELGLYADYLVVPGGIESILDLLHFHLITTMPVFGSCCTAACASQKRARTFPSSLPYCSRLSTTTIALLELRVCSASSNVQYQRLPRWITIVRVTAL